MADERDAKALELRRAGIPIQKIREELRFRSDQATEDAIGRALAAAPIHSQPNEVRLLELDRLDRLLQGVWLKAARGDVAAIDRVLKISELRMRWAGTPAELMVLTAAYDSAVEQLKLKVMDGAAVSAGRAICQQIDIAGASGDPLRVTKALYLMPHLMTVLDKLGATPAARDEIVGAVPDAPKKAPAMESDLERFRRERGLA
jgi:hypothetical protein